MRKELHKDFNEVIFDKLNEWKNADGEEFSVNLIDAFWLMHLDFEHFIKHSRRFEDDFQNYPTNMFDKIDYETRRIGQAFERLLDYNLSSNQQFF